MKKILISLGIAGMAASALFSLSSCGDELAAYPWIVAEDGPATEEDISEKDMGALEAQMLSALPQMLKYFKVNESGGHGYQYSRLNSIDNYAGYWTTTKANFMFGPALATLYTDNNGYLGGPCDHEVFSLSYSAIHFWNKAEYTVVDGNGKESKVLQPRPEWRALALIAQGYAAHEIIDFYGCCPFNDWRNKKSTMPLNYEAGPEVYKQIFADLDEAIATLKKAQPSPADMRRVEGIVPEKTFSGNDWRNWVKLANSIKLRMAMNMVDYVDPDPVYGPDSKPFVSKNIAEEAVADEIGVFTDADPRDFGYHLEQTSCVWYQIGNGWNDLRLCASLENILKHFKSPLLDAWFDKNSSPIKNAKGVPGPNGVYGVRIGLMMEDTGAPTSGGYGPFGQLSTRFQYMGQPYFKRTEGLMLMAEGALRGWNMGGTAKDFYERGIRLSLKENAEYPDVNITDDQIEKYLKQDELPAVEYRDYYNRGTDMPGRVTWGVAWEESDSNELKLEKIITQKYIANFPMGAEAWTNYRRTGYPRLFPPKFNNMANVDAEMQIRRLPYVANPNNAAEIAQITELMGGSNDCGTRVFWDVNSVNWAKDENGQYIPNNNL